MPRSKKVISIDEAILIQEDAVSKAKAKYNSEVKKLKDLHAKRDELRRKTILDAVEKSSHSYEEILEYLQSSDDEEE